MLCSDMTLCAVRNHWIVSRRSCTP